MRQSEMFVRTSSTVWRSGDSYLDGIPVLAGEGVDGLLLETLLALGQSLVPMMKTPISALSPLLFDIEGSPVEKSDIRCNSRNN